MEKRGGQRGAMVPLVLENDLGQRHGREVLTRGGVDDRDLLARTDHLLDLFERDVAALLRVVEFSVRVPLDHVRHGALLKATMNGVTPRVKGASGLRVLDSRPSGRRCVS